jgi:hypothetical protein
VVRAKILTNKKRTIQKNMCDINIYKLNQSTNFIICYHNLILPKYTFCPTVENGTGIED